MASYPPVKTGSSIDLSEETLASLQHIFDSALQQIADQHTLMLTQSKLLNLRFEEMAETHLNESDVEK